MANHGQINPPEPSSRDCVTCEQCGDDLHRDDMQYVGGGDDMPIWICRDTSCLKHYAEEAAAENYMLKRELAELKDPACPNNFGRWDILPDAEDGRLVLWANPDEGRYRVVGCGGAE